MAKPAKLHGRAFYESLGSPKLILAPMVDQSEFAWRLLTRSFLPPDLRSSVLAYSPMLHAKLFADGPKYRASHFEPLKPPLAVAAPADPHQSTCFGEEDLYLDGNPGVGDRPLFVQFCANDAATFLEAAKMVAPYCDAVDLNLGCPQGIARRGRYGSFLQEDWDTIGDMIRTLHERLDVPVTAKMRILETRERTLAYARMMLDAGASILTVHGRLREQKSHNTGLADWGAIRYLREHLPEETVIFANGNVLQHGDLERCLDETGADGVMSAEGNLYDPSIFADPPAIGQEGREYWRGRDGKGGYRCDAVLRRYLDIIHKHVLGHEPPRRGPLFLPSDPLPPSSPVSATPPAAQKNVNAPPSPEASDEPPRKKRKGEEGTEKAKKTGKRPPQKCSNANLVAMQAHCFHILRPLVSKHHDVRDALARSRAGDVDAYENVLTLTEKAVREGLLAYERNPAEFEVPGAANVPSRGDKEDKEKEEEEASPDVSSDAAVRRCKRPYWVCQPYVRPLPKEALEKGSLSLSKKEKARLAQAEELANAAGVSAEGAVETVKEANGAEQVRIHGDETGKDGDVKGEGTVEVPREGLVCG